MLTYEQLQMHRNALLKVAESAVHLLTVRDIAPRSRAVFREIIDRVKQDERQAKETKS